MYSQKANQPRDSVATMTKDQEHIRQTILAFMDRRGLSMKRWAQDAGIGDNTLRRFLKTEGATITHRTLEALAAQQKVPVGLLTGELDDREILSENGIKSEYQDVILSPSELSEVQVQNLQLMVRRLGEIKDELSNLNENQLVIVQLLEDLKNQSADAQTQHSSSTPRPSAKGARR